MTVGQPTEACLRCQNLVEMEVALAVQHVGGNVYDVHCLIDDGPSRQLVYSLPDDTEPGLPPAPRLGEQLARFVVGELEQACGRQRLQSE